MTPCPAPSFPELLGAEQRLLGSTEDVVDANWKVLVEGFVEGYHLKATHPSTFLPFGYDNVTVVETFGRHSRITFPFRRIEALRDVPASERSLDGMVTLVYHLFPNVIVARLSHHTTVVVLEPRTTDSTTFVTYQLTNQPPTAGTDAHATRDADFVRLGAAEDRDVALAVQRGLTSRRERDARVRPLRGRADPLPPTAHRAGRVAGRSLRGRDGPPGRHRRRGSQRNRRRATTTAATAQTARIPRSYQA